MSRRGDRLYDRSEKNFFKLPKDVPADFAIYFDGNDEKVIAVADAKELENKGQARKEGRVIIGCPSLQIEYIAQEQDSPGPNRYIEKLVEHFEKRRVPLYLKARITGQDYWTEITTRSSNLSLRMSPPIPMRKCVLRIGERHHRIKDFRKTNHSAYHRLIGGDTRGENRVCLEVWSPKLSDQRSQ